MHKQYQKICILYSIVVSGSIAVTLLRGCVGCDLSVLEKKLPFLKEYKNENIVFAFPHFNFCLALERFHYVYILLEMSILAAKINHNESFTDNDCSIAM